MKNTFLSWSISIRSPSLSLPPPVSSQQQTSLHHHLHHPIRLSTTITPFPHPLPTSPPPYINSNPSPCISMNLMEPSSSACSLSSPPLPSPAVISLFFELKASSILISRFLFLVYWFIIVTTTQFDSCRGVIWILCE